MIKSISDLLESAKTVIGENTDDKTLEFIGDLSDTLGSFKDSEEKIRTLEQEKADLDSSWRQKYRDRFFSGPAGQDDEFSPEDDKPTGLKTKFEELFETK